MVGLQPAVLVTVVSPPAHREGLVARDSIGVELGVGLEEGAEVGVIGALLGLDVGFLAELDVLVRTAVAQLDGKTWEQLDPQFFARRSDGLDFLSDTHLAAVLPQYLHLLIVFRPTSPVPETLLPLLTRPELTDNTKLFDWQRRRFEGLTVVLTEAQKRMVARALTQFVEDAPNEAQPATRALDRYWHAFLA